MHVHIVAVGIRKWGGGRERSPQRDVRRRDRYAGVYGSRPLDSGLPCMPPCFFVAPSRVLRTKPIWASKHPCRSPFIREEDSLASLVREEFQIVDNWLSYQSQSLRSVATTPQRSMRDISHHFPFNPSEL